MSLDGKYIFDYSVFSYIEPTPMKIDIEKISQHVKERFKCEAEFNMVDEFTIYFEMPKHTLPRDLLESLRAERILEKVDSDLFVVIR